MIVYKGNLCPVCNKRFAEGDDIVVCPDCGTPYHRECWAKVGVCVNAARHGTNFEWKPEVSADDADVEAVCPNCGTHNPPGAQYCNHCGVPLQKGTAPDPGAQNGPIYARDAAPRNSAGNAAGPMYARDNAQQYGGPAQVELGPDDLLEGYKAKDWASYIGRSAYYYLMQFTRMSYTKRKTGLSFSAFLFGPAFFFYRKMWKQGVLFALLDALCSLPTVLYLLLLSGSSLVEGMATGWLVPALNVCYVLNWAQMVVRSLFALYWYKQQCARNIQTVYSAVPEGGDRTGQLALRGGTSIWAVVLYMGVVSLAGFAVYSLLGPNLNAVLSALSL